MVKQTCLIQDFKCFLTSSCHCKYSNKWCINKMGQLNSHSLCHVVRYLRGNYLITSTKRELIPSTLFRLIGYIVPGESNLLAFLLAQRMCDSRKEVRNLLFAVFTHGCSFQEDTIQFLSMKINAFCFQNGVVMIFTKWSN